MEDCKTDLLFLSCIHALATCDFFYQEVTPISPLVTCIGQWKAAERTTHTICSV